MNEANEEIFDVEDEKIITKANGLPYPAVTLTGDKHSAYRIFNFNVSSRKFLYGPYVRVSRGKINGENYWCFRNSVLQSDYIAQVERNRFYICANKILEITGLSQTDYRFTARKCCLIKDGLAVSIYESEAT